jgi:hypothetical protein
MSDEAKLYWSPVAEYLGICIAERGGDKEKTWQGRTYHTDGLTYITQRPEPNSDAVQVIGFDTEREAKEYIDDLSVAERKRFFSMLDFWNILLQKHITAVPKYEWDELSGGFVQIEHAVDGQNRIKNVRDIVIQRNHE